MSETAPGWIVPGWPAPPWLRACATTRQGGVSLPPYDSMNLGEHVGDDPRAVRANRDLLRQALELPAEPRWLNQVHGTAAVHQGERDMGVIEADAAWADRPGVVLAVMTADCLPLLLCDRAQRRIAAVHAGWRGLAAGVIEKTIDAMDSRGEDLLAWLGPAIGPQAFEVGEEVRAAFLAHDPAARDAFLPHGSDRWLADIYRLARLRLHERGVRQVSGGGFCTHTDRARFHSYRRDGRCGRMASLVWMS